VCPPFDMLKEWYHYPWYWYTSGTGTPSTYAGTPSTGYVTSSTGQWGALGAWAYLGVALEVGGYFGDHDVEHHEVVLQAQQLRQLCVQRACAPHPPRGTTQDTSALLLEILPFLQRLRTPPQGNVTGHT